jgi:hypothetical protein
MKITDFYPVDWSGKTITEQRELFDQILTFFTQNELHKIYARKITRKEWIKRSPKTMERCAHLWACDTFKDILQFYQLTELECGVKNTTYISNEKILHRTYAMYDDYFESSRYTNDSKYENVYLYISAFTAY